jgi:hypothetical protein
MSVPNRVILGLLNAESGEIIALAGAELVEAGVRLCGLNNKENVGENENENENENEKNSRN